MAGAGRVIAQRLRRRLADEDAARVAHLRRPARRVLHQQTEVLGSKLVGQRERLIQRIDHDGAAARLERGAGCLAALQGEELAFHLLADLLRQLAGGGNQDRRGQLIVLRLSEQVGRAERGICRLVGDDDRFARAVEGVDAHVTEDRALRQRDEDVARPAHLIDLRHALGAVGEGGDRLRAAHAEDAVDSGDVGGDELERRDLPLPIGGRGDQHLLHAGRLRWQHGHQHGRGVDGRGAWHVAAYARQRPHPHAYAIALKALHGVATLLFVEGAHPIGREAQRFDDRRLDLIVGGALLLRRHTERLVLSAVEGVAVAQDGSVTLFAHVLENASHRLLHRRHVTDSVARATPDLRR